MDKEESAENVGNRFVHDKENHVYTLDGAHIPSVTQIIAPITNYDSIPTNILSEKARQGTAIHETIRLWLDDKLDETALAEGNKVALDLFIEWWWSKDRPKGMVAAEFPLYNPKLFYAGTPDLVFDDAIVDIKTGRHPKDAILPYSVQLAGYAGLFPKGKKGLYVLHLNLKKNKYDFVKVIKSQSWYIFRYLLDYYRTGERIKLWKKL